MFDITLFELAVIVAIAAVVMSIGNRQPVLPAVSRIYTDVKSYWRQEPEKCLLFAGAVLISASVVIVSAMNYFAVRLA